MTPERPRASVIVAVREPGQAVADTLASLERQDGIAGAEVLVADGSAGGVGEEVRRACPRATVLALGPRTMPALKAAALGRARGEVLAILDPGDVAEPGWLDQAVRGLETSGAAAVGGTVHFDGPRSAGNRAAYLFEYGAFASPLAAGPTGGDLPGNNVAYRRSALLDDCRDLLPSGFWKPFFHQRIRDRGGVLWLWPAMQVRHRTRHRLGPFGRRCFHFGRCFGAMRLDRAPAGRRLLYRAFAPAVWPLLLVRHVVRATRHPGNRRMLGGGLLALAAVTACWGLGEWLGYWLGPGRSCEQVR